MSQSMYTQQELQPLVGPRNDRNTQLYYTLIVPPYVIGASLSEPHTSVLMQKFGIYMYVCMYICMYIVVVRPTVNPNFAYYAIRIYTYVKRITSLRLWHEQAEWKLLVTPPSAHTHAQACPHNAMH